MVGIDPDDAFSTVPYEKGHTLLYYLETLVSGVVSSFTKLVPDMVGIDPDDAFSTVPYEKGHTLLYYLETLVGGVGKIFHQVGPRYGRNRSR